MALEAVRKLDFYLAKVSRSSFRLPKKDEPAAFAVLRRRFEGDSLDAIFANRGTPLVRDARKNIVDVRQGGDEWAFDLVAAIAKLAKCEFVLQDDVERKLVARIEDGKLRYYAEALAKDWRAAAKRERCALERLLAPMGFKLDEKAMRERKKDIDKYWGEAARREIDRDVPFTILRKTSGTRKIVIEYASHATSHTVTLKLSSTNPLGHFAMSIPTKIGLRVIADSIAHVQGFSRLDAAYAQLQGRLRGAKDVSASGAFSSR